jgi:hypothetical protein
MKKDPNEEEDKAIEVDEEVREIVEQLPGYQEFRNEQRGDSLTYGDW